MVEQPLRRHWINPAVTARGANPEVKGVRLIGMDVARELLITHVFNTGYRQPGKKRIASPQGFITRFLTKEGIYAVNSLNRKTSSLKQAHYTQSGKKTQMSLVKNSRFLVLPFPTNYQFPNRWELPDVRYRCDYATSTTKERTRECQRRCRIQHVFENIIANNAVEVTRWEVQFRAEIPVNNSVNLLLRFLNGSRVTFDSPDVATCSLPQAGSETSGSTTDVKHLPAKRGHVFEHFRARAF